MDSDQKLHLQSINQAQKEIPQQHRPFVPRKADRTQLSMPCSPRRDLP